MKTTLAISGLGLALIGYVLLKVLLAGYAVNGLTLGGF